MHQIRLHGPSGHIEVELEGDNPQACLDQVLAWMREGTLREMPTRQGTARINMAHVWAAEFLPSGREISS
jgi:hypothetical protein